MKLSLSPAEIERYRQQKQIAQSKTRHCAKCNKHRSIAQFDSGCTKCRQCVKRIKKTEWIDGTPKHIGVYETNGQYRPWHQHWNGKFWGYCENSVEKAHKYRTCKSDCQSLKYRGLSEQP